MSQHTTKLFTRGVQGVQAAAQQVEAGPDAAIRQTPSNMRFNSFCERFVIERCKDWPQEHLPEAAWRTIQDAKGVYAMIQNVSSTVKDR